METRPGSCTLRVISREVQEEMSGAGSPDAPETAVEAFTTKKTQLLRRVRGKWVLIHETEVIDFYNSRDEAVAAGYAKLTDVPFLVRQVPSDAD